MFIFSSLVNNVLEFDALNLIPLLIELVSQYGVFSSGELRAFLCPLNLQINSGVMWKLKRCKQKHMM